MKKCIKNESILDRILRFVVSIVLFIFAAYLSNETLQVIFFVIAVLILITSASGFCLCYKLFDINTNKKAKDVNKTEDVKEEEKGEVNITENSNETNKDMNSSENVDEVKSEQQS